MVRTPSLNVLSHALYNARRKWATSNNIEFTDEYEEYQIRPQEQTVINLIEQELGLEYLDYGASRIIFESPKQETVIKIARYGNNNRTHDGIRQNRWEVGVWEKILENNDRNRFPLLPVNQYNTQYYWIKKPKLTPLHKTNLPEEKKKEIARNVEKQTRKLSAIISIFDIIQKHSNIGIDKNQNGYLLDYGLEPDYNIN